MDLVLINNFRIDEILDNADSQTDKCYLNNDELCSQENALSEISTHTKDTGAIATTYRGTEAIT